MKQEELDEILVKHSKWLRGEDGGKRADLESADLESANLRFANLESANLRSAILTPIKNDMFIVLLTAIPEIQNLKAALIGGKIDGSTYDGECACLAGTLEKTQDSDIKSAIFNNRDASRPIERFFLGIKKGDTPDNSQFSKLALEWIEEFEGLIKRGL